MKQTMHHITVFPNPVNEKLTIVCTKRSVIEVQNTEGQILKRIAAIDLYTTVDLSDLPGGIYIIKVITEDGITVKKIIKTNCSM